MKGHVFTLVYLLYAANVEQIDSKPTLKTCTYAGQCQSQTCPSGQVSRCLNDKKCHCERYFIGCADAKHGDYAINPANCNSYLRCISPIHVVNCPGGLHFDARALVCDWSYNKPFCPRTTPVAPVTVANVVPAIVAPKAPAAPATVAPKANAAPATVAPKATAAPATVASKATAAKAPVANVGQLATSQGICQFITCQNSGTCVLDTTVAGGFRCDCKPGFSGVVCETVTNTCASVNCNQGTCSPSAAVPGYTCTCNSGWTGTLCDQSVCANKNCNNRGRCKAVAGVAVCECDAGWEGASCATKADVCKNVNCNNGYCQWTAGKPVCTCNANWKGDKCDIQTGACGSVQCQNGATCTAPSASEFKCNCKLGFSGVLCEKGSAPKNINDACVRNANCQPLTGCTATGQVGYCSVPGFQCKCKTNKVISCATHATCSTGCDSIYGLCMANGKCNCFADQSNYFASMHLNNFPNSPIYIQQ